MAKLKGEFYTKKDAYDAMGKIDKYCLSVKVFDYDYNSGKLIGGEPHENFASRYSYESANYMNHMIGIHPAIGFIPGVLAMGWTDSPYEHGRDMYGSYDTPAPKAILNAEVQEDKYSIVKERLYSCGAISVY